MNKLPAFFARWFLPKLCLGETSVIQIRVKYGRLINSSTPNGVLRVFSKFPKTYFYQTLIHSIDNLFTMGIKVVTLVRKTQLPVPKTVPMPFVVPPDLARIGDFTQGQESVKIPAATVPDRAGSDANDGQPLPGASPPIGGHEAPTPGRNRKSSRTGHGISLPACRAF